MKLSSILKATVLSGIGLGLQGFSGQVSAASTSSLTLEPCFVKGIKTQVQCGKITVPENWQHNSEKTLDIHVIRIKAVAATAKKDPLFLLMGGPGQASSELAGGLSQIFSAAQKDRDLVLIDQRGTGKSSPLTCDDDDADMYGDISSDFAIDDVKTCLATYRDIDLAQYNTNNAILDFEAVRKALGYEQINLYGISYGSRAAMVYMRDKPEALRSVILDGVVPPQVVVGPMGEQAARAFDILIKQCSDNEACAAKYPTLYNDYQAIRAQLENQVIETTIDHPITDKKITLRIDSKKFIGTLRGQMYGRDARLMIPYIISEFAKQNYKPFVGLMSLNEDAASKMYIGLTFNILCNEALPRATANLLAKERSNTFSGRHTLETFTNVCQYWPKFTPPANFADKIVSDIPTMLLSGELDPVTPPAWAEIALQGLSNHQHYIAKKAGHGLVTQTCAAKMVSQFIANVSFDDVSDSCLDEQPTPGFLINNNGNL